MGESRQGEQQDSKEERRETQGERLQKVIAASGLVSRRAAETLILEGRVSVNGKTVTTLGTRVLPSDRIQVNGQDLPVPNARTIALHKPVGYITTRHDPAGRATIYDLLPKWALALHPIGRLDRDSSGLLLLTNQGDLTLRLTHPRAQVEKVYVVDVKGHVRPSTFHRLSEGILLDDGPTLPAKVRKLGRGRNGDRVEIVLTEGRNRQVRRMFASVGHPVERLKRVAIASLRLGKLRPGEWRNLSRDEVERLSLSCSALGRKLVDDHES